jgi:hypothetical protein
MSDKNTLRSRQSGLGAGSRFWEARPLSGLQFPEWPLSGLSALPSVKNVRPAAPDFAGASPKTPLFRAVFARPPLHAIRVCKYLFLEDMKH